MTPRFRADWDRFSSLAEYEEFTEVGYGRRSGVFHKEGSMFIFCSHTRIGPISSPIGGHGHQRCPAHPNLSSSMVGQSQDRQDTFSSPTTQSSGRPKTVSKYRFNDRQVKLAVWEADPFNNKRGQMKRNIWLVPNSGRENKTGFPAQKPIEEYNRMIQMAGKTGAKMLDIFGGSGTGAVAALRGGMDSITIERDPGYVANIIKRVEAELRRKR